MNDEKTIRLTVIQQAIDIARRSNLGPAATAEEIVETARKLYEFINGDRVPATKE